MVGNGLKVFYHYIWIIKKQALYLQSDYMSNQNKCIMKKVVKVVKEFPRTFRSSSAAYRAIRQYEEKIGKSSKLKMTTIGPKVFHVAVKMTVAEFMELSKDVKMGKNPFRYFPDGANGEGYYELKKGNRRRPNSEFLTVKEVYDTKIAESKTA